MEKMTDHFTAIAGLEPQLSARKLRIFRHQYDYLNFGSWILEVGQPHRRLRFIRDGKEGLLVVSKADLSSQGDRPDWNETKTIPGNDTGFADVLKEVDSHFS